VKKEKQEEGGINQQEETTNYEETIDS